MWFWHRNRQADQGNGKENPQIHLNACGNLVYDKGIMSDQGGKDGLCNTNRFESHLQSNNAVFFPHTVYLDKVQMTQRFKCRKWNHISARRKHEPVALQSRSGESFPNDGSEFRSNKGMTDKFNNIKCLFGKKNHKQTWARWKEKWQTGKMLAT